MQLVSAMTTPLSSPQGVPVEIVYIPEGVHEIRPTIDGKPGSVTVTLPPELGEEIAARLQASLEERLGSPVRPHLDFDHAHSGPAAAIPTGFRYEAGRGILLALDWSGRGRAAIEGKDYSYFSPEFLIGEDGTPHSLPAQGPIGSLVNEPAFRTIPRIAARHAATQTDTRTTDMHPSVKCGLPADPDAPQPDPTTPPKPAKPGDETEGTAKDKRIKELEAELAALKKERDEATAAASQAAEAKARNLVAAACADGRIAPRDEATKEKFLIRLAAGDGFAEEILAGLPRRYDPTGTLVQAASTGGNYGVSRIQAAQSRARGELGAAAAFETVWARAQEIDPAAFND